VVEFGDEFLKGGENVIPQKNKKRKSGVLGGVKAQPAHPLLRSHPSLLTDTPIFLTFFLSPSPCYVFLPLNPSSAAPNPWGRVAK